MFARTDQPELKAVRFIATDKNGVVRDIIEVPSDGIYTYYGQYRVAVQRHVDKWLHDGLAVTREEVLHEQ